MAYIINIGREFSDTPAGREPKDGPANGQLFIENFLLPALRDHDRIIIELDDTEGYGSSFLEESFGGLVRNKGFSPEELHERLELSTDDEALKMEIWSYIDEARSVNA